MVCYLNTLNEVTLVHMFVRALSNSKFVYKQKKSACHVFLTVLQKRVCCFWTDEENKPLFRKKQNFHTNRFPVSDICLREKVFVEKSCTKYIRSYITGPTMEGSGRNETSQMDNVNETMKEHNTPANISVVPETKQLKLSPPQTVCGMKKLDKSAFNKNVTAYGIYVPLTIYSRLSKLMKNKIFPLRKRRCTKKPDECLLNDEQKLKLILFDPDKVCSVKDLEEEQNILAENGVDHDQSNFEQFNIELTYDTWNGSDIIRAVLPSNIPSVSSYTLVGKLAHFNLRQEHEEYKHIIGEVTLDKMKYLETVVNKTDNINNVYRNFQLELLAGEKNYVQTVKVNGFSYKFDFSKVYWNTRLGTEHDRIATMLKAGDVLYDVFAGVGPFAIPAAKKKVMVFANDLNPASYQSLLDNIPLNKIKTKVHCSNLDGRDFIKTIVKKDLYERWTLSGKTGVNEPLNKIFITMNLPAMALEFLDAFVGLMADMPRPSVVPTHLLPYVHCYCFSKSDNPREDVRQRAEKALREPMTHPNIAMVRNVSPNKDMWRVMFQLTTSILWKQKSEAGTDFGTDDKGPEEKKRKLESE